MMDAHISHLSPGNGAQCFTPCPINDGCPYIPLIPRKWGTMFTPCPINDGCPIWQGLSCKVGIKGIDLVLTFPVSEYTVRTWWHPLFFRFALEDLISLMMALCQQWPALQPRNWRQLIGWDITQEMCLHHQWLAALNNTYQGFAAHYL